MSGDEEFAAFYQSSVRTLVGQLFVITGDLQEAEDVVQEAYVRAWGRWADLCGYDAPEAWVRRVAINLARNGVRRARRQLAAWVRHGPDTEVPELTGDEIALTQVLRTLPRRYREVLTLHYLADLPVQAIAGQLGAPEGTVKARLARGRRLLAARLRVADPAAGLGAPGG